ncbi:unnamed protein product [Schistosoma curassoni]|uniref:Transposase n=1 Tax=Schistosoma curassoni TaxID=6186 RepID=A0A183JJQ7_9TREM|nr:unnamed protein product [Schistosoma curassoni]
METSTYLVSIIDKHGGSDADVKARIGKARTAFSQSKYIWDSKQIQPILKSQSSIRMSRYFYCTELKLEQLLQPSS